MRASRLIHERRLSYGEAVVDENALLPALLKMGFRRGHYHYQKVNCGAFWERWWGSHGFSSLRSPSPIPGNVSLYVTLISQSDDGVGLMQPPVGAVTRPSV